MSDKLGAALKAAGINRIVLIRHANAAPPNSDQPKKGSDGYPIHDWQRDDQMRPLTEKGKKQGGVAREWFHKDITVASNKVLVTSGAQRATQTLQLLGEQQAKKKGMLSSLFCTNTDAMAMEVSSELLPSLHPAGIAPKCEELFDKNGYAPLAKFYAMEGGEAAFAEYAEIVAGELCGLAGKVASMPGNTLSLFGHAVFLNAVAMMLCSKVWGADADTINKLKDLDLGEAEGIEVTQKGDSCTLNHKTVRYMFVCVCACVCTCVHVCARVCTCVHVCFWESVTRDEGVRAREIERGIEGKKDTGTEKRTHSHARAHTHTLSLTLSLSLSLSRARARACALSLPLFLRPHEFWQ